MKFSKEFLQDTLWGDSDAEKVEDQIVDTSRWSIHHRLIFEYKGVYFMTTYSEGATECQDESPFEFDDDYIECHMVQPVEKTYIDWEKV